MCEIKIVDFKTILPYWHILWPHMKQITETSPIDFGGNFNTEINKNEVIFLAVYINNRIVGVNSILKTSKQFCRSRGLWVDPLKRKQGIGTSILKECESIALKNSFKIMWSMPRQSSLDFYLKNGFKKVTSFFYKYEFGPHCFVFKSLKESL